VEPDEGADDSRMHRTGFTEAAEGGVDVVLERATPGGVDASPQIEELTQAGRLQE
jgi:hypothetical protein